jgi:Kef-type K+ transport system membrane component KefB
MSGTASHYLIDILALLLATVVVIPLFHAIRLGAILGYLTAGIIIGPWGLEVITEVEQVRHLAEFGVVFLLFALGIELEPKKTLANEKDGRRPGAGSTSTHRGHYLCRCNFVWVKFTNSHHSRLWFGFIFNGILFTDPR